VQGGGEAGEDGDELEPVLAAAFLVGEFLKVGDEGDATFVESGELFVREKLTGGLGAARRNAAMAVASLREFSGINSIASPLR